MTELDSVVDDAILAYLAPFKIREEWRPVRLSQFLENTIRPVVGNCSREDVVRALDRLCREGLILIRITVSESVKHQHPFRDYQGNLRGDLLEKEHQLWLARKASVLLAAGKP